MTRDKLSIAPRGKFRVIGRWYDYPASGVYGPFDFEKLHEAVTWAQQYHHVEIYNDKGGRVPTHCLLGRRGNKSSEVREWLARDQALLTCVPLLIWPLEKLGLSTRIRNRLDAEGIYCVDALARCHSTDIERVRGLGTRAVEEIQATLRVHGLELGMSLSVDPGKGPNVGPHW